MKILIEDLLINSYKSTPNSKMYKDWALQCLEDGVETESILILTGLEEPLNKFEVKQYFESAISELGLTQSTYSECILKKAKFLCCSFLSEELQLETFIRSMYRLSSDIVWSNNELTFNEKEFIMWYGFDDEYDFLSEGNCYGILGTLEELKIEVTKSTLRFMKFIESELNQAILKKV